MHPTAVPPAKRHHSQISTPSSPSNASAANHGGHTFEHFMHMFGTFNRPSRQQRQAHGQPAARTSTSRSGGEPASRTTAQRSKPKQARQANAVHATAVPAAVAKPKLPAKMSSRPSSQDAARLAAPSANAAAAWRRALCPRTQKTYYWNVHTRESRWKKPLELASDEEREAIRDKERKQKEFFEAMERNILRRLEGGRRGAEGHDPAASAKGADDDAANVKRVGSAAGVDCSASPVDADEELKFHNGIDQSWMQMNSANDDKVNEDWVSGWITPGSSDAELLDGRSPSCGSLSSIEGLSVLDPNHSGFSPCGLSSSVSSLPSLGSLSQEERDDNVLPLNAKPKMSKLERIKSASSKPIIDKPDLIRTISKMEYDLVYQLNPALKAKNPRNNGTPAVQRKRHGEPLTPTDLCVPTPACDILSSLKLTLDAEGLNISLLDGMASAAIPVTPGSPLTPVSLDDSDLPARSLSSPASAALEVGPRDDLARPNLTKRNTCGTIYLGSTLSAPDKDALIKCVCGVYRAHLLQTQAASAVMFAHAPDMNEANLVFHDRRAPGDYRPLDTTSVPALKQVTDFYRSIFLRSQMEADCIIISLVYVERLIKMTGGALTPRANNWRSVLFSCMVLASKVWDDLSMWNCDFSKIGPSGVTFSLARTNELEVALLRALEYRVKVGASEYAKYYFLLRGMLCRSGLASDDLTRLRPLDAEGARTLDAAGEKKAVAKASMKERSKSYGVVEARVDKSESMEEGGAGGTPPQGSPASKRVTLEQIVRM